MNHGHGFYSVCFCLVRAIAAVFFRLRITGRENLPEGAAMVCANHSSILDPFLVALAYGVECNVHIIAKVELFKIPIISPILKKLGMISVNRGILDAATVKTTLGYLRNGEVIVIFPEGTRVSSDDAISAKTGAVKIAEHADVPLVPLYIPRKKALFSYIPLVIGEPYYIKKQPRKRVMEDYKRLSATLMDKIKSLNPGNITPKIRKTEFGIRCL